MDPAGLEARIEAALRGGEESALDLLSELYDRYRAQQRLLDRLIHISDRFQQAERERGLSHAEHYQRKVRQIEKIVRISDQYQRMLQDLNERLHRMSTQDDLTGLPNRRYMRERIAQAVAQSERGGMVSSIALADVDHFKKINDNWGHAAGDAALVRTARLLLASLRDYDVCARWGGEEFLLLFFNCGGRNAAALADRIRQRVAEETEDAAAGPVVRLSIGVTEIHAGEPLDEALKRADDALYRAKAAGRDQVVLA